jgi:hypothetical protein
MITADASATSVLTVADSKRTAEGRVAANGKLFWLDGNELPF